VRAHSAYFDPISPGPDGTLTAAWCPLGFDSHTKPLRTTHELRFPNQKGAGRNQIAEERLMTIADLSTMLGVPSTPSVAGVIVVKDQGPTVSAATFAIALLRRSLAGGAG
jgi:hypothetical protein